jgi:hypothetical protein
MATGSLDVNGVWIYGEDDSEATFSGLLNKLGDSVSDQFAKENDYKCILLNSTAQALTTTPTKHTWAVELYDPKGLHATSSADIIAPFTGIYRITYSVTGATTASVVDIYAYIRTGTTDRSFTRTGESGNNQQPTAFWSGIIPVTAGQAISVVRGTTYGPGYNSLPDREYFAVEYLGRQL